MRGFDDKALLLFPGLLYYQNKPGMYHYTFKMAFKNMCDYLESVGMEPHLLYSDDVARILNNGRCKYVQTLSTADRFFTSKYCDGMSDALTGEFIEFPEIYNEITAKDPGSLNMTIEERFEMVLRHAGKAAAKIIPTYKVVVHFLLTNRAQYRVTSKPGDGKIRITVNASNFSVKTLIGGVEENPIDLLNIPYACKSVDKWG